MANAHQVRASINTWLGAVLPLDPEVANDRIAYQASQAQQGTEWRVFWDTERDGRIDQQWNRLVQIDRLRSDGDEMALELDWAAALAAMALDRPGSVTAVQIYDNPDAQTTMIGRSTVRRLAGQGWILLPDPAGRLGQLRSTLTLRVDYAG